jgi:hypothetical protein
VFSRFIRAFLSILHLYTEKYYVWPSTVRKYFFGLWEREWGNRGNRGRGIGYLGT